MNLEFKLIYTSVLKVLGACSVIMDLKFEYHELCWKHTGFQNVVFVCNINYVSLTRM